VRERRALRFLVEALFLGALAAALVVADLDPLWIAGVMLLGWIVVAFYEWAATRELPHYGRGLPPRYYVPQIALPPPRQLEQLRSGYPAAGPDDQATWIATPAMRAEALADWPVNPAAGPLPPPSPGEDTMVVDSVLFVGEETFHEDTWIELDPIAEGKGRDEVPVAAAVVEEVVEIDPEPAPSEEPPPAALVEPPVEVEDEPAPPPVADEPAPAAVVEPPVEVEDEPAPLPVADEPEVVEAVVEEADEEVLEDVEPAVLAAAIAAPEAAEPLEPQAGNGVDPVLAAAAAETVATEAEPEVDPYEGLDPVVAVAAAGAAVADRAEPDEPESVPDESEDDRGIAPAVAAAAVGAIVADRVAESEPEPEPAEADGEPLVAAAAVGAVVADPDLPAEPEVEDDTEEDAAAAPAVPEPDRPARHTFDPLAGDSPTRRRWRRRDDPWVEVPSGPPKPVALPGAARREP
jgi:hypothetical protein